MEIEQLPDLDRPNVIAAFHGWNDAGQAATTAVRYLVESWHAQPFAKIDSEEYYSYSDTRPTIRIVDGAQRELTWPSNQFFSFAGNDNAQAAILMIGVEPNLRWKSFCGEITRLAKSLGAQRLVTMGSLVMDTAHTRPVPLNGFSTDPQIQARLAARNITRSSYEGPTGIVGVLHDACRREELPTASVWAASPHYLGTTPNPKTALGLLDALDDMLGLHLNLSEMRTVADEFVRQVSLAVAHNDEVQDRIRAIEEQQDALSGSGEQAMPEFPPTGAIIADLESFLREQRDERGA
ncbi:MAG: PAC2 family protein [Chloroflexota bacterium]|nr:PAC2 family protein [Chloroflexota bacterium]